MTADEISFAGGLWGTRLTSPYAWYYTNSANGSVVDTFDWWTLSPYIWNGSISDILFINGSRNTGKLYSDGRVNFSLAVRPVISLALCAKIKSGIGTPVSPYEIDENSCS